MNLERIGAILELIANGVGLTGQLTGLASGNKASSELHGNGHADHEAASLGTNNLGNARITEVISDRENGLTHCVGIGEQGRDVLKDNTGLGIIGDVGDKGLEVKIGHVGASFYSFWL